MTQALTENVLESNLSYINGESKNINSAVIRGEVEENAVIAPQTTTARISMTSFYPQLTTDTQIGYWEVGNSGVCGYIAANLIIGYNYFAFDYGLISNSSYVNFSNKTMNGPGLTKRLIELDGKDPDGSSIGGTDALAIFNIMDEYFAEVYNTEPWTYSWYLLGTNVKSTLDAGYPVAIFGNLNNPQGGSNINHAVVACDYANYGFLNMFRKYRVHFGWSGYASVWLESPVIGSDFYMRITT